MCTIALLYRVHLEFPLVVAANRDEFYQRPASRPQLLSSYPHSIGGLDLREQGTWMGANERGLTVGLTNQRTHASPDLSLQSRGRLVRRLLGARSVDEIRSLLLKINPAQYNPFNLFFGDAACLFVAYARHDKKPISLQKLEPGVYALCNDRIGSPEFPKADRVRRRAIEIVSQPWSRLKESLVDILSDHDLPPIEAVPEPPVNSIFTRSQLHRLQAVCIHGEHYGTCSATLIALSKSGVAHYLFADGPPCQTPFTEVTEMLL
ncbi:MAG: NRDE family protein [Deltaproteobacteria bacterium]|nr:NRDE family protein [Deltaproteobacteria bacterium]